jgi:hypothetical protein
MKGTGDWGLEETVFPNSFFSQRARNKSQPTGVSTPVPGLKLRIFIENTLQLNAYRRHNLVLDVKAKTNGYNQLLYDYWLGKS